MDRLILICLIVILIENAFGMYNNAFTIRRNYKISDTEIEHLKKRLKEITEEKKTQKVIFDAVMKEGISKTAFLISKSGVQMVPDGWEEKLKFEA